MPGPKNNEASAEQLTVSEIRNYKVVKSNELIQKSRFQLSAQEQKIILYLISKIKSGDDALYTSEFGITEFCRVCGLDTKSGKNHKDVKDAVKALADKSIWVTLENGKETIFRWLDKPLIDNQTGTIQVKFDDLLRPYLLQLKNNFTQFELLYTLAMKSQYSIRLYELLKSYLYKQTVEFSIDELKKVLSATCYVRYPDFRRNVIDIAVKEISALSDINAAYEALKAGRRYVGIQFTMSLKKDLDERFVTWKRIQDIIGN